MSVLHDPSEQLYGLGQLWIPQPYHSNIDVLILKNQINIFL